MAKCLIVDTQRISVNNDSKTRSKRNNAMIEDNLANEANRQKPARLSSDACYCRSQITWAIDYWHQAPVDGTSDDPVLTRLRGLAESLICLMDSGEFDVEDVAYQLRFDPDRGDPRDLPALLRASDEQIEAAEDEADEAGE
jgi:hypothetical protein